MTDITNIFGGAYTPQNDYENTPEQQLREAIESAGLNAPDTILLDGKIHRFDTNGKKGDNAGWYIAFNDGVPAGRFGCWRDGVEHKWCAAINRELTIAERMAQQKRYSEAKAMRQAEQDRRHKAASESVEKIWAEAGAASPDHDYLRRKGIAPHGARVAGDGRLMTPLYNANKSIDSIQYISGNGEKKYHYGGAVKGRFWSIGEIKNKIYIAEGFATAATIHEITGDCCYIAYSASNLPDAAKTIRELEGNLVEIVIVADNDEHGVGKKYADQAAQYINAKVITPPTPGDANDYYQSGGDLLSILNPTQQNYLISADEFCAKPAPIKWLIKGWLQQDSLIMVHGPSGSGKTFYVLDQVLTISSSLADWHGLKAKPCNCVYLAGEGHSGLRGRIAAWKQKYNPDHMNMWVSNSGCDLNEPSGYLKVVDSIKCIKSKPDLIVVDTLHRFLVGDENSAKDAKTMLDACAGLMREFECSVLLVHHTGVSDEAQHRARGSSAWRGALDIEINIKPTEGGFLAKQVKAKDSELAQEMHFETEKIEINGWFDEDNEPVSSLVIEQCDKPEEQRSTALQSRIKTFERAWFANGAKITPSGEPYLTRDDVVNFLINNDGFTLNSAKQSVKQGDRNKLIGYLLNAEIIKITGELFIVIDKETASSMLIMRA